LKTETLHERYLGELKDLYSAEHPLGDATDSREAEAHRNRNETVLVFAAPIDNMG
jgi:hypothetical protein